MIESGQMLSNSRLQIKSGASSSANLKHQHLHLLARSNRGTLQKGAKHKARSTNATNPTVALAIATTRTAPPEQFLLALAEQLIPGGWRQRTRPSNHGLQAQLHFLWLAAMLSGKNFNTSATIDLRPGEQIVDLVRQINKALRRAGCPPLSYFGLLSNFSDYGYCWHCHLAVSLPEESKERVVFQDFLCRRYQMNRWDLWRRGNRSEAWKPVFLHAITDKIRGWRALPGFMRYLDHHFYDADGIEFIQPILSASDDIRLIARELATRPKEGVMQALEAAECGWGEQYKIDAPTLHRVVARAVSELGMAHDTAVRRTFEAWQTLRRQSRQAANIAIR